MDSLYSIETRLLGIIEELEETGGEFTPEIEEALTITEQEFKQKLTNYCDCIAVLEAFNESAKCEKDRINKLQQSRKNIIEKLKERMKDAVLQFGDTGKTGNKTCDLPTRKLYTRNTTSVEVDDNLISIMLNCIIEYAKRVNNSLPVEGTEDENINKFIDIVKTLGNVEITKNDVENLTFTITKKISAKELFENKPLLRAIAIDNNIPSTYILEKDIPAMQLKNKLSVGENITFAHLINKTSLTIK